MWKKIFKNKPVDGCGLQTPSCDPMHRLWSSGYTLSGIYISDLSLSPRSKMPKIAFLEPFFDIIHIPIKHSEDTDISSKLIIVITFSGKFQLGEKFISLIYTIPHTNPWVSASVHTLAWMHFITTRKYMNRKSKPSGKRILCKKRPVLYRPNTFVKIDEYFMHVYRCLLQVIMGNLCQAVDLLDFLDSWSRPTISNKGCGAFTITDNNTAHTVCRINRIKSFTSFCSENEWYKSHFSAIWPFCGGMEGSCPAI